MLRPVVFSESIEVRVDSISKLRFYFETNIMMNKHIITRIDTLYGSTSHGNKTMVTEAVHDKSFLILVSKGKEVINRLSLKYLNFNKNYDYRFPMNLGEIDWVKSYIEVPNATGLVLNSVFYFVFYYEDVQFFNKSKVLYSSLKKKFKQYIPALDRKELKVETIKVKVDSILKTKFYLPDFSNFRNKKIVKILVENQTNIQFTAQGNLTVADAVFNKSYLTLANDKRELINNMPLQLLQQSANEDDNNIDLRGLILQFSRCYIIVPNTTGLVASTYFLLTVFYYD